MSRRLATTPIRSAFVIAVRAGSTIPRSSVGFPGLYLGKDGGFYPGKSPEVKETAGDSPVGELGVGTLAEAHRALGRLLCDGAERLLECLVDPFLDRRARLVLGFGDLAHEQELRALQHALLAERERLAPRQVREPLQHHGHLEEAARAHLVRVLLEAALPVRDLVDLAVAEQREDLAHLGGTNHGTQPHAVGVLLRDPDAGVVGEDPKLIEADLASRDRAGLDALHHPDSVIRIDDLLANLELHGGPLFPWTGLGGAPAGKNDSR